MKLLADLVIDTPTALGKFFSDLTETVISEKSRSKAALVEEVRKQFAERIAADAKTKEQLQNQLRAATEAQQKADKLHTEQVQGLQKQLVEITHTNKQKDETNQQQIRTLTEQIKSLNGTHQQQIQAANKHMEELQRQLAEADSKEEARFKTLQDGFAAQPRRRQGRLNSGMARADDGHITCPRIIGHRYCSFIRSASPAPWRRRSGSSPG